MSDALHPPIQEGQLKLDQCFESLVDAMLEARRTFITRAGRPASAGEPRPTDAASDRTEARISQKPHR